MCLQTVDYGQFKLEICGGSVPNIMCSVLFCIFASPISYMPMSQYPHGYAHNYDMSNQIFYAHNEFVMTFEDLLALYVVFKHQNPDEMAQVAFYLIYYVHQMRVYLNDCRPIANPQLQKKYGSGGQMMDMEERKREQAMKVRFAQLDHEDHIFEQDYFFFFSAVCDMHGSQKVEDFRKLLRSSVPSNELGGVHAYNMNQWKQFFKSAHYLKNNSLFSWLPELLGGFAPESLNIPSGAQKLAELEQSERRLTMGFAAKVSKEAEKQGLTNEEVANIRQFYSYEIKGKDAGSVLKVFQRMFRDISNIKLRKYLLDSCSQVTALNFSFLCNLALVVCRDVPMDSRVDFLFDVFTRQKPNSSLKKSALKDFIEIFKLDLSVFPNPVFVSRDDFLQSLNETNFDIELLYEAKPMITALMCLIPGSIEEERASILAVLNGNPNLETYIYENLPDEQQFYVLDKKFWDEWTSSVGFFNENATFNVKGALKSSIQNGKLIEFKHEFRLKDAVYNEDFILLPKYAFFPLNAWYSCDKIFTREVISWKHAQIGGRLSSHSRASGKMMQMSSQKFYNPKEESYDLDMQRRVADWIYELEVYPKVVYLSQITPKGEKLHTKALVNRKLDRKYIKSQASKTDSLPFKELQLSKKTTLQAILNQAAKFFGENVKKGRLHIDEAIVHGVGLLVSLEDYGIQEGQLIYVEFANQANEWPSDKVQTSQMAETNKLQANQLTTGLLNLGNTCYMNSALQCIANLKPVHEYFIEKRMYVQQINMKNPLGHQGDLVYAFAELMKQMWQRQGWIAPRDFKQANSKCAGQFEGNDQQDSQEYIAFLIDGLHEELNLRKNKPYIENPESDGRKVMELGLEYFANSLRRDWSFFFFTFYGLSRSSINCGVCNRESITFETFSSISLPLPEPAHTVVSLIVHRLPNRVREQLGKKAEQLVGAGGDVDSNTSAFMQLESDRDFESGFSSTGIVPNRMPHRHNSVNKGHRVASSESTRDRRQTQLFTESFTYNTNDMPIHICIKVDNEILVKDIQTKIAQIREVNVDPKFDKTELVLFYMSEWNNSVRHVLNPLCKLSQYRMPADTMIYAVEVVKKKARDDLAREIEGIVTTDANIDNHLRTWFQGYQVGQEQERQILKEYGTRREEISSNGTTYRSGYMHGSVDMYQLVSQLPQYVNKFIGENGEPVNLHLLPSSMIMVLYQRRFVKTNNPFLQIGAPQMVFRPVVVTIPPFSSSRMLYEEVWSIINIQLKQTCDLRDPTHTQWWQDKIYDSINEDNITSEQVIGGKRKSMSLNSSMIQLSSPKKRDFRPFVIRRVKPDALTCSRCHWRKRCAGCILIPNEEPTSLVNQTFMVIDWHPTLLAEMYNPTANELIEHTSVHQLTQEKVNEASSVTSLEDCLFKFHKREELENTLHCKSCQGQSTHTKRLDIFQPPPVMIIQLKRFKQIEGMDRWRKLSSVVDFPIFNLDMSGYLVDKTHVHQQLGIDSKYDLHGYVNHMGTLSNGHYIATLRNPFNRKWYQYDDHHVNEVSESGLMKEHAYLLFYVRKDMVNKHLGDIFPSIEKDLFLGKPVKTHDSRDAYVLQMQDGFQPADNTSSSFLPTDNKQSEKNVKQTKATGGGSAAQKKEPKNGLEQFTVKLSHKEAAKYAGDPVQTVKLKDLAEEPDKDIIVYNSNELQQIDQLKLKRIREIETQKSIRISKSQLQVPVPGKKKRTASCFACLRSKATVANKDSEDASEDEGEPLRDNAHNVSSERAELRETAGQQRHSSKEAKNSNSPPSSKNSRKRKSTVQKKETYQQQEAAIAANATNHLNSNKPQRTRTPMEGDDEPSRQSSKQNSKHRQGEEEKVYEVSDGEKAAKDVPHDDNSSNQIVKQRSKTMQNHHQPQKLSTDSNKGSKAWMEENENQKEI